jgi:hypothetical protein
MAMLSPSSDRGAERSPGSRFSRAARAAPAQTARSQVTSDRPMLSPAIGHSRSARKRKVSRLNTEKVVKPPQMPVMTNWRIRALTMSRPPGSVRLA